MINPILAFSARRRMRTWRTPVMVTLYCLTLAVVAYFYSFRYLFADTLNIGVMRTGFTGFITLFAIQFMLLVLVGPAMTSGSIAGERERQTLELLQVTNTGSFSIVIGKLLDSFGFLCLLIIASLPIFSLVLLMGGIGFLTILKVALFLMLIALAVSSIGLFTSTLVKRTVTATVTAYLLVLGLGIVTLIPLWWDVAKLGERYEAFMFTADAVPPANIIPISFVLNPVMGALAMIMSQFSNPVQMQDGLMDRISHTLSATFSWIDLNACYVYHMIFLAVFSLILIFLSACLVRPSRYVKKLRKGKK